MLRPVVALATCSGWPDLDEDGALLIAALAALGIDAGPARWDDAAQDWTRYDLVVVRNTWDYFDRLPDFLRWSDQVPRLANPAAVLRWNTDKHYLRELTDAGVAVVATTWRSPGDSFDVPPGEYVVKPAVSAGARDTARYGPSEAARAGEHVGRLLAAGRDVMVQPYLAAVDSAGETSLLFFDGVFSHAASKAAILRPLVGVRQDINSRSYVSAATATQEQRTVAEQVLAAAGEQVSGPLLYARVDLVPGDDGAPLLLELEVTEPSLFLTHAPGSAHRLAAAIAARVQA